MRAVVFLQPGDESALHVAEVPEPACGPDEVRIRIAAAGVNRADLLQRRGLYPPPPGASEILGLECAGTISEVGDGVEGFAAGEKGHHAVADGEAFGAVSDLRDRAGALEPEDLGSARWWGIEAPPLQQVGAVDPRRCDADPDLARTAGGVRNLGYPQHRLVAGLVEHHGTHGPTIQRAGAPTSDVVAEAGAEARSGLSEPVSDTTEDGQRGVAVQ
jgi:hypothetical protein